MREMQLGCNWFRPVSAACCGRRRREPPPGGLNELLAEQVMWVEVVFGSHMVSSGSRRGAQATQHIRHFVHRTTNGTPTLQNAGTAPAREPCCTIANGHQLTIPGLSRPVMQYQDTGSRQLSGVEFFVDRLFASRSGNEAHVSEFRAFLLALTVPPESTEGVATTAPPRALFIWPKLRTIECIVGSVESSNRQFGADGAVLVYVATVGFEEILDTRVTSEAWRG